jgi:hypothetical protein
MAAVLIAAAVNAGPRLQKTQRKSLMNFRAEKPEPIEGDEPGEPFSGHPPNLIRDVPDNFSASPYGGKGADPAGEPSSDAVPPPKKLAC